MPSRSVAHHANDMPHASVRARLHRSPHEARPSIGPILRTGPDFHFPEIPDADKWRANPLQKSLLILGVNPRKEGLGRFRRRVPVSRSKGATFARPLRLSGPNSEFEHAPTNRVAGGR